MNAADLIGKADFDGVRLDLTPEGGLHYAGDPVLIAEWLPVLREHKIAIVAELHRERRHKKVLAMLGDGRKYAVLVEDDHSDPVIATCAIRGVASFDLSIPRHSYSGIVLLELIEKHSSEASQLSDHAIPSPDSHGGRAAHPTRRAA